MIQENTRTSNVTFNKRPIYIEVCNLGESNPEKKINEILKQSAMHLGKQVISNCYLQLTVDTEQFVFVNDILDPEASLKKLKSEIDDLCLSRIAGFMGYLNLEDLIHLLKNKKTMRRTWDSSR